MKLNPSWFCNSSRCQLANFFSLCQILVAEGVAAARIENLDSLLLSRHAEDELGLSMRFTSNHQRLLRN